MASSSLSSPPPFFLPAALTDEDLAMANMTTAGVFDPNAIDFALAAQCTTPALPAVSGMPPLFNTCYSGTPRTLAPTNVWPGATDIATGSHMDHHGDGRGNNSATLKMEDVEPSHLPSAVPTASSTASTAKPAQTRGKKSDDPGQTKKKSTQRKKRASRTIAEDATPEQLEKRARFLERNRTAASKCRKRRKEEITELQNLHQKLKTEREQMVEELSTVRTSIAELINLAMTHQDCQDPRLYQWVQDYQATQSERTIQPGQQEQEVQGGSVAQLANENTQLGLPATMPTRGESTSDHSDSQSSPPSFLEMQNQQHQQHQLHQHQLHQQQMYQQHHHQLYQQGAFTMAMSVPPESVPAPLMMPVASAQPSLTVSGGLTIARPMHDAPFTVPSPQGSTPPSLVQSDHHGHNRGGSIGSYSSTVNTESPGSAFHGSQQMLRVNSTASSAASFPGPSQVDEFSFVDTKNYDPSVTSGSEEEDDGLFSQFYAATTDSPPNY